MCDPDAQKLLSHLVVMVIPAFSGERGEGGVQRITPFIWLAEINRRYRFRLQTNSHCVKTIKLWQEAFWTEPSGGHSLIFISLQEI